MRRIRIAWLTLFFSSIILILLLFTFRSQWLEFGKDVYRLFRSEVHLALFRIQMDDNNDATQLRTLILPTSPGMTYIAHGTGQVNGLPANNSLEGLNASFGNGCRFIEADFEWTSDQYLISIHDWGTFFGEPLAEVPDLSTFVRRRRTDGLQQLTFEDIDSWLVSHPKAILITDVKSNNLKALSLFRTSKAFKQIIPQTYSFLEFSQAIRLGFERIILTTYMTYYSTTSLRRFVEITRPSALTVPVSRLSPELIDAMAKLNVPVFTHPVPFRSDLEILPKGVKGIYSSTLCE
jgi:hypothetical protein